MKALKSKLAAELLADPEAGAQLRQFLTNRQTGSATAKQGSKGLIEIRRGDKSMKFEVRVVPKAAGSS
jgi:hypothetical protein